MHQEVRDRNSVIPSWDRLAEICGQFLV